MSRRGRKRRLGAEDKAVFEWERDRILPENLRDEMETMWEIPQIYHFLQLTKEAFNISHLSMYEVERMLLMPRASKQLAHIMTCLLSSPSTTKSKLQKVPPMPYEFWTNILTYKLRSWFKIYQTKRQDPVKVFDTLGVEPEFWTIFPDAAEIEGKDFQDFSFRQRVWLLKTVCDTAIHSRKTIQEEVAKQPSESQFETVLGVDRYGARYIYFPQFLHNDIRVYKHCLDNEILSTVKPPPVEVKPKVDIVKEEPKPLPRITSRKKRRKSRWSNGSLPLKNKYKKKTDPPSISQSIGDANSVDAHSTISSGSSSKVSEMSSNSSLAKSSEYETNVSSDLIDDNVVDGGGEKKVDEESKVASELMENLKAQIEDNSASCIIKEDTVKVDDSEKSTNSVTAEESLVKENSLLTVDDLSKSSKTDDEKLEVMSSLNASKTSEKSGDVSVHLPVDSTKDVNISKSDDEKLSEHKICDTTADDEPLDDDMSLDKWMLAKRKDVNANESFSNSDNEASDSELSASGTRRSARIKHISEIKLEVEDVENLLDVSESEELSSIDLRDSLCRVSSPEIELDCVNVNFDESKWKVNNFSELIKDLSVSNFQLVADSLDSLRDLIESIASDKTIPAYEPVKEHFVRPKCEDTLLKRLRVLCTTLENVEAILNESVKKARIKLQREWNNFENGVVDEDQDCNSEHGANRWLIGSQGWPQVHASLPPPTLSGTGTSEATSGPSANFAEASTSKADADKRREDSFECRVESEREEEFACKEIKRELIENEAEESAKSKEKGETQDKESSRQNNQKEAEEPTQTKRVLRARGVSSYTEQLLSDESEEEDELDGWADIEAIYATPSSQANASSPNTPTKSRESCDESDEEDSDQDWILPSSRKRKIKRQSASRRLKSFQHKLQNINKVDHDGKIIENQQQQPVVQGVQIKKSPTVVQIAPRQPPTRQPAKTITRPPPPVNNLPNNFVTVTSSASQVFQSSIVPSENLKREPQDSNLHTVLDIKDEGPIYDNAPNATCVQPNYVVVTTGHAPVANYYVMQQNPPVSGVMQQNQFIQPTAFVSQMVPQPQIQPLQQMQTVSAEGYYVQQNPQQNYIVQNPPGLIATGPRQAFIATPNGQVVYQQQPQQQVVTTAPNYIQYVTTTPSQPQLQQQQPSPALPRIINAMTLTPPRQINYRMRAPVGVQNNRMPLPARGQNFPHPNGAVIRSAPINANVLKPGQRIGQPRSIAPRRQIAPRAPNQINKAKPVVANTANTQKTTSLIVLSDSDDEIEMIIPANSNAAKPPTPVKRPAKTSSNNAISTPNDIQNKFPAELIQRIGEGNISISPIKPAQPAVTASSTQLVVVVNETGSHYALALPNGGKLILTPEQVAQIRASNGGKLVL